MALPIFKPGDRVLCVRGTGACDPALIQGETYTVLEYHSGTLQLENMLARERYGHPRRNYSFDYDRFVLAPHTVEDFED